MQQLLDRINEYIETKSRIIVAIDGMSAAGKSSLAARLSSIYTCGMIPMDHFFLQQHQRTPERLAQPGGNIDYERFLSQVVKPLGSCMPFSYRPYDCSLCQLSSPVEVNPAQLVIIEGVYCLHPVFGDYYDLPVFLQIDKEVQRQRLAERDPSLFERFINEWLPMETMYFEHFDIRGKCDLVLRV